MRYDQVETLLRNLSLGRVLEHLLTLLAPVALHHDGQAINHDIEKAANYQAKREHNTDEKWRRFREYFGHQRSPSGLLQAYTKTALGGHSERRFQANVFFLDHCT